MKNAHAGIGRHSDTTLRKPTAAFLVAKDNGVFA
jgi:hypothetical protein